MAEGGLDSAMKSLVLDDSKYNEVKLRKEEIRSFVWETMDNSGCLHPYPPSSRDRIPNFLGSAAAAARLSRTREFAAAGVVKVNPSLAQMPLRRRVLGSGKKLLVPAPALEDAAFFFELDPGAFEREWQCRRGASKAGAAELGRKLGAKELKEMGESGFKIDLFVVASVAVSPFGVRLGKGRGFAELEWAILFGFGLVDADTVVATSVHERQILSASRLGVDLMEAHDLPVDIIVTPERIVNTRRRGAGVVKPSGGVLWERVTTEMRESVPVLRELEEMGWGKGKSGVR